MSFRVALTFDAEHPDRPHHVGGTAKVLDLLAMGGIQATFFVQGRWAESDPGLARAIPAGGHLVGNHSFYHARMPLLSTAGITTDVRAAERAIIATTGMDPRPWFRCPFSAGTDDPRVVAALARLGYRDVGADVHGSDWVPSTRGRGMARAIVDGAVAHGDGAVVLLHPWTPATGLGLATLVDGLRSRGAEFVRLDTLA